MDQQYPTVAKIPMLDTGKFKQWQFWMQQYIQHEHYALWEVIEFEDSYEVPENNPSTMTTSTTSGEKSGRMVTLTTEDMLKKKNDVKARTTLLLSLPDEHQLGFTEGSKTLEQMFTRLQVIVGQLQFMEVEVEQDDLNQKFLTSLAPEWLMHTIKFRRNQSQILRTWPLSLEQFTAGEMMKLTLLVFTLLVVMFPLLATASISQETTCAYIASQSGGSQIKFKDINQINEDDMEEMDIKWNMALLSMRADKFWKKTGKKISIQGSDVAGTLEYCDKGKKECIESLRKELESLKQEKEVVDRKLAGLLTASKDLDNLIKSQRSDKSKEGLGYTVVPPPSAQLYLSPKKDLSWTGIPECANDNVTNYSRPSPNVESSSEEDKNRNPSPSENVASPITPKQFVKYVKASDSQSKSKTDEKETPKKPPVKDAKQYRKPNKKPNVRGNQRNWNNMKSHQLVRSQNRAPWVPTVNRNFPPVKRKFSTGSRNFPANKKFSTANRKFSTGSTKVPTADMGMKGKAVKPSACWSWKPSQNLMLIQMARRVSDNRIHRIADRGNEEDGPDSRARGDRFYHNRRSADRGNEKVDHDPGNISNIKGLRRRGMRKRSILLLTSLQEPSMLVEEESCPVYDTDNEEESKVIYDTYGNDVDDSPKFELLHTDQGNSLGIQRVLSVAPSKSINDDSWRRNNIFRTKYNSNDKACNMINDGGSCENAVSTYMVEKLALKPVGHPEPYQFTWLKKRNAIKATYATYLILNHLMEDMYLLARGMQDYRKGDNQNRNSVLFTDSKCIALGRDFKLLDDANILLRTPRQHNMYSIDLNNIVPHRDLTCLVAKASADECYLWHRRLA
nr:hypothetical protein [Tanacetum cinerariifolium]